jgi:hypothetical protein
MGWINLGQVTIQCWVVLNTVMKGQLHKAVVSFILEQIMKAQRGV